MLSNMNDAVSYQHTCTRKGSKMKLDYPSINESLANGSMFQCKCHLPNRRQIIYEGCHTPMEEQLYDGIGN